MRLSSLLLAGVLACAAGCSSCPPTWLDEPPTSERYVYGGAQSGALLGPDVQAVALTRATRVLAEQLGLDVTTSFSVVERDDRVWVEAVGPDGPHSELESVEIVERVQCGKRAAVLVRVARPDRAR